VIRRLLFILFLYILLVWLIIVYLFLGDTGKILERGLLWTVIGVAGLLGWLILERVIDWYRARRARTPQQAATPSTAKQIHEDDAALLALLREADRRLAEAPSQPGARPARLTDLPLYLVLGPEGSGKTAVTRLGGGDPALLAGQAVGDGNSVSPTRVANVWLCQKAVYLEVSGRVFAGEPARFAEFLGRLHSGGASGGWLSKFLSGARPVDMRGVLLVIDARQFTGIPELSKLDRAAQQTNERLAAAAGVFGTELPVYVLFSKVDAVPHYSDYFARLGEGEVGQVFGVLVGGESQGAANRVWAEAETKRLIGEFNSLSVRLNDRRLAALAQESDASKKPAVYEFPREFKRIRTPLVQFLVDTFRPDPLRANPRLRGFFFSGVRKVEASMLGDGGATGLYGKLAGSPGSGGMAATQILRTDQTVAFQKIAAAGRSGPLVDQWMFIRDLFGKVLPQDTPAPRVTVKASRFESQGRLIVGAAAGICAVAALIWTYSWIGNWQLESSVLGAARAAQRGSRALDLANLRALDQLRFQLEELDKDNSWSLHWGLYSGDRLKPLARRAYFQRLKELSLDRINQSSATRLLRAGEGEVPDGPGVVYDLLKTHRTITARGCPVDMPLVSRVLRDSIPAAHPNLAYEQAALLRVQLDYYTSQLGIGSALPVALDEDNAAEAKARAYLRRSSGLEQQLRALVSDLNQQIKPLKVADYAEDYRSVLTGPAEFPAAFTKQGLAAFTDRLEKGDFGNGGERCVTGDSIGAGAVQQVADVQVKDRLKSLYFRQYADEWRQFLGAFNVVRFAGVDDAAHRLNILDGPRSPLLGIIKMAAVNTNFTPAKPGEPSWWEKGAANVGLGSLVQTKAKGADVAARIKQFVADDSLLMTSADIARLFQPVAFTTPPELDRLVNDNDGAYVQGMRGLQQSLEVLARASTQERATAIPQAQTALQQARAAQQGLSDKFTDVGNEGLSRQVSNLLGQPIQLAEAVIPSNNVRDMVGGKNGALKQFCSEMSPILRKYPFNSLSQSDNDAALVDIARGFAPGEGLVWKYVQKSASDIVARNGQEWQPNPAAQGLKVTPELIAFLNRAQSLTSVMFSENGMMQPRLRYVLRPSPGQSITIRVLLDGEEFTSANPLQKTFFWPAPAGARAGAEGTIEAGAFSSGFGKFDGIWGVFRLFQSADERPYGMRFVQWSEIRGRGGAVAQRLNPPVKVELVEFPGGVDLLNPKFFETLRCPDRAVAAN